MGRWDATKHLQLPAPGLFRGTGSSAFIASIVNNSGRVSPLNPGAIWATDKKAEKPQKDEKWDGPWNEHARWPNIT